MSRKNITALILLIIGIGAMLQGHSNEGALICIIAGMYAE